MRIHADPDPKQWVPLCVKTEKFTFCRAGVSEDWTIEGPCLISPTRNRKLLQILPPTLEIAHNYALQNMKRDQKQMRRAK
jgi:hypothetical protein